MSLFKADHYRLSSRLKSETNQWQRVCEHFNIAAILAVTLLGLDLRRDDRILIF